ncbi:hypothetical protein [Rhizobium sp. R693]|uniref:hypothetical protein n=1 Tax=Rhizobium sp. R693 TaxID=1764276 RepID=UPI001AEF3C1F|nr:hypothetical protein [Rhizobium sp. R693]
MQPSLGSALRIGLADSLEVLERQLGIPNLIAKIENGFLIICLSHFAHSNLSTF